MDPSKTALERAFDMARSGKFLNAGEIATAVKREGYPDGQVDGRALRSQLTAIIKEARAAPAPPGDAEDK
jgi:hypothetical protein